MRCSACSSNFGRNQPRCDAQRCRGGDLAAARPSATSKTRAPQKISCRWLSLDSRPLRCTPALAIARLRTNNRMSIKKTIAVLFVSLAPLTMIRSWHRRREFTISRVRTRVQLCSSRKNYDCTARRGIGIKAHVPTAHALAISIGTNPAAVRSGAGVYTWRRAPISNS